MLSRNRIILLSVVFIAIFLAIFFLFRRTTQAAFGPAVALCPGPDLYGYSCQSGAGYAYIDATNDTRLYEDEGTITLELPFPFTFYGTAYTEVTAAVNGNLQFTTTNPTFVNDCMTDGPVIEMGDLIAPYWDDLDLRFIGYLETEVVGETPDRIFVVEWDAIPRYGDFEDDLVTFEVQLFEGSNDIVFLYEDVTTFDGYNGSSATIGLQSEAQGLALQYGCHQAVVGDASGIYFPHPVEANGDIGQENNTDTAVSTPLTPVTAKGHLAEALTALNQEGLSALTQLRPHWLNQNPPLATEATTQDLTGDGRSEYIFLWHSTPQYPYLGQIAVFSPDETNQMTLLFDHYFSTRAMQAGQVQVRETADLTADRVPDLLLEDETHQLFVLSAHNGTLQLYTIPGQCQGGLKTEMENGRFLIVRDGCEQAGRVIYSWDGQQFVQIR